LVLLCLVEGLAFLKPLHLAFVSPFGKRFSVKGSGLRFLGLLPFTRSYLSHRIPIGVTAAGVYVLGDIDPTEAARFERESFQFLPYDQLTALYADDVTVHWNKQTRTHYPSQLWAVDLVEMVRKLCALGKKKRTAEINAAYSKGFDLESLSRQRDALTSPLAWLSTMCGAVFYLLLLFLPLMIYFDRLNTRMLVVWLILLVSADLAVAVTGYRLIRKMRDPGLHTGYGQLLWYLSYPPAAIHAASKITREMYRSYDHLTVAASTLSRERFVSIARAELYGIALAMKSCDGESWQEFWGRRKTAILALLQQVELSESEALRSPARKDPVAARFCPVCEMEYIERARTCTECQFDLVELGPS
jgi:hypothetical protein